ncbi:NAD(P)-binding protein [Macrolepiota fuliginosa MF-IS2]|uniref:NAD(P)-binding protein n=1 Tax=Macrolepiota fuliginosa MF-IS2 TaxID=1400762 RepID=A0A9P6BZS9_9AGAR|nr:NAD(P)-binding protein [Macrolepiota fuliginosa MF-IS2]
MPSLSLVRKVNAAFQPRYTPTAVFVGGTSGIGRGMVEVFAQITQGKSDIVIVGRNQNAAENIFSNLPHPNDRTYKRDFIQCDVTRMKNVQAATTDILTRYPKINFLVLSTGIMTMKGRDETEEGLDTKLAVHYYSRWKFVKDLLPSLNKASEDDEDAKVFSVLAPGKGGNIDLDDLGLKKTFSVSNAALQAPTYNDLMMEAFYDSNPSLTFIHGHPGVVRTSLLEKSDTKLFNLVHPLMATLLRPVTVSPVECGEYMWHAVFNSTKGVFRTGSKGEDLGKKRYFGSEEAKKKLWEHTVEATTVNSQ